MGSIDSGHFLMGVDARVWYRLIRENRGSFDPARWGQAALLTLTSTALAPAAALERALFARRIRVSRPVLDPLFVVGHWRSGTTYLQNMLSRDPQFGWADPVHTVVFPYSQLLGRLLTPAVKKGIANGRPMDNVQYSMDLPMEETFALLTQTTMDANNMIVFPTNYQKYLDDAFVGELSEEKQAEWRRAYDYVLSKLSMAWGGKRLVLKSPENSCHIPQLLELYPDARFLNIHRDPYKTVRSTVHMFTVQMDKSRLSYPPENQEEAIEDAVIQIFGRMYRSLFAMEGQYKPHRYAEVAFRDFTGAPLETLERVYEELELPGFTEARPRFQAFMDSQRSYQKNQLTLSPLLIRKINRHLGFYFDHYGYERKEATDP